MYQTHLIEHHLSLSLIRNLETNLVGIDAGEGLIDILKYDTLEYITTLDVKTEEKGSMLFYGTKVNELLIIGNKEKLFSFKITVEDG